MDGSSKKLAQSGIGALESITNLRNPPPSFYNSVDRAQFVVPVRLKTFITYLSCSRESHNFWVFVIVILRTVRTNSKVFLRGLLNMREKQILTERKLGVTTPFSKLINQQYL